MTHLRVTGQITKRNTRTRTGTRTRMPQTTTTLTLACTAVLLQGISAASQTKPNIVWIMAVSVVTWRVCTLPAFLSSFLNRFAFQCVFLLDNLNSFRMTLDGVSPDFIRLDPHMVELVHLISMLLEKVVFSSLKREFFKCFSHYKHFTHAHRVTQFTSHRINTA